MVYMSYFTSTGIKVKDFLFFLKTRLHRTYWFGVFAICGSWGKCLYFR